MQLGEPTLEAEAGGPLGEDAAVAVLAVVGGVQQLMQQDGEDLGGVALISGETNTWCTPSSLARLAYV